MQRADVAGVVGVLYTYTIEQISAHVHISSCEIHAHMLSHETHKYKVAQRMWKRCKRVLERVRGAPTHIMSGDVRMQQWPGRERNSAWTHTHLIVSTYSMH
jgi:hypothetical protein